ncbi:translation initiation factor eIF2B subunit delta KNAG_0B01190 [Huiozyma naganishii CBS 8797]|uniref:Translation initiation factor eIF2B subunit delta n=1 Tax=Huiozyma naganishii (strain ATCC MYA-139 / BCRC 22969 / CBS 8797 / KCTC 17520 / NBRC 10181 / NCYC 3082 / Yp74L-3) TaxID=1071383 RepID=J7S4H2_HUIN7|nr:hypothetical protein KNAG_0B01190 [Kazachstania naganishii CBS 8797]CCK68566.1 hypothetical protein KNAG_0B01190 [Kazachstania naganishii CBS 8797]
MSNEKDVKVEDQNSGSAAQPAAETASSEKKLSNKELKELKKREKAAKRSAQKQASGITIEQQQLQAQAKREKKKQQQHREEQKREAKLKKIQNELNPSRKAKKTTLFSHLETTEERRASILAISSAVTSPVASRITASGLMIPMVASVVSGSQVYTTSSFSNSGPTLKNETAPKVQKSSPAVSGQAVTVAGTASVPDHSSTQDIAKSLATMSLESEDFGVVPGISSIVPHTLEESFENSQLVSSVKELLLNKDYIHPAITLLTTNLAHYKIVGSIPRCIAMLEAFQIVIRDYQTPKGTTLSRNLTNYLSHQIDILKKARPLSVTMGNAIRWIKQEISHIDPSISDEVAKQDLCEQIAQFAREKIELADQLIIENASNHIEKSATIVVYGSSKVISDLILHNTLQLQKNIKVIVVDSRPLFEGRSMANMLRRKGVDVMYSLITSLDAVFDMGVDYVFLGAHSILSNGFLYSRVGTAMIAMSAKRRNIPVLVCCESLKFSQRVQLDSVTFNELADPNDLVSIDYDNPLERRGNTGTLLKQFLKERETGRKKQESENKIKGKASVSSSNNRNKVNGASAPSEGGEEKNILDSWHGLKSLNIVNILYDLTPPEYIKKVITEFGALPPSSVPVILREYKGST